MNIACSSCPAKYAVPDEKVRGRKVRITCKRCGAAIIVDGTALGADAPAAAADAALVRAPQHTIAGGTEAPAPTASPASNVEPAAAAAPAAASGVTSNAGAPAPEADRRDGENDVATTAGEAPAELARLATRASHDDAKPAAPAEPPKVAAVPKPGAAAAKPAAIAKPFGAGAAKPLATLGKGALGDAKAAGFPKPLGASVGKAGAAGGKPAASIGAATLGKAATAAIAPASATNKAPSAGATAAGAAATPSAVSATQPARAGVQRANAATARAVAPSALPERTWTVAVTDDDHHEMTLGQIVDAYAAQTIDAETFIWRDGMQDWLMPFEIADVASALRARRLSPRTNAAARGDAESESLPFEEQPAGAWREPGRWDRDEPSPAEEPSFDDVTVAMEAPKAKALLQAVTSAEEGATGALSKPDEPAPKAATHDGPTAVASPFAVTPELLGFGLDDEAAPPVSPKAFTPTGQAAAPKEESIAELAASLERETEKLPFQLAPSAEPARAALKSGTNETGGGPRDLFARRPLNEVREELDAAAGGDDGGDAEKAALTGARNESSVLFSLDQLAKPELKAGATTPKKRDEAALLLGGTQAGTDTPSVAGLGAGGLFGATNMAAPDFTAPPPPSVPPGAPRRAASGAPVAEPKPSRGAGVWIGALVALGLLGGAAYFLGHSSTTKPAPEPSALVAPAAPTTAEPAATAPAPSAELAASAAPSAGSPTPEGSVGAPGSATPAAASGAPPGSAAAVTSAAPAAATGAPPAAAAQPRTTQPSAPAPKASATVEPAAAEGPAFDKDAAMATLATAGANAESQCGTEEGPHGSGKVTVTFANSGRATNAVVSGDFAGSALGGCIARIFRSAHVPAFGGDPVRVSKTVRIQ